MNYSTLRVAATVPSPALSKTWTGSDRITQPALVFFAVEGAGHQQGRRVRRSMGLTSSPFPPSHSDRRDGSTFVGVYQAKTEFSSSLVTTIVPIVTKRTKLQRLCLGLGRPSLTVLTCHMLHSKSFICLSLLEKEAIRCKENTQHCFVKKVKLLLTFFFSKYYDNQYTIL